ncbi:unnamed protein product [Urochloa decumbens]|uniref:Protein kinase domain-containing protein n=1 Tax=Urochloa decumbens TaxID=240449 RepID=A0ABC9CE09_9POAL
MACSLAPALPHQMFHRVGAAPHQMMRKVPTPPPPPPPEEARLSDFEWIGDLGAGGFAKVSKVRHRRTGAVFALKMSKDADPKREEEAEVLRRAAGSPHVVGCHALLRGPGGEPGCVLELMDAGSLGDVLRRRRGRGGLPEHALAEAAAHCAVGLAQLHSRGVAHLDVKPDNFLASSRGEIKIGDFNTSRILYGGAGGEHPMVVPLTAGTRCYFSPERFAPGARAGPHGAMAADVWSLGVTVLELFLGRFAFARGLSAAALELAICQTATVGLYACRKKQRRRQSCDEFVEACLQREPVRRATVKQLLVHPFLARRDVQVSRCALRDIIVSSL